jgi:hypothetical protein
MNWLVNEALSGFSRNGFGRCMMSPLARPHPLSTIIGLQDSSSSHLISGPKIPLYGRHNSPHEAIWTYSEIEFWEA